MPIKRIAFDEMLPDMPFVGETNGMARAVNILPLDSRNLMSPKALAVHASAPPSSAAGGAVRGAMYSIPRGKYILGFFTGLTPPTTPGVSLLEQPALGSPDFTDVSKTGGYSAAADVLDVSFCQFGDFTIATWLLDPVQYIDSSASKFDDLITSTTKPKAKHCCASKVHLVLGWITEGGNNFPRRVWWSAQGDPQDFEPGSARAGFTDLDASDGEILAMAGFEDYFLIWTDRSVLRFDYVGGDQVWHAVQIGGSPESMTAGMSRSVVKRAGGAFYRGQDGYKVIAPTGDIVDIGQGKIRSLVREAPTAQVAVPLPGAIDAVSGLVVWAGVFGHSLGDDQGSFLVFNPGEGRFTLIDSAIGEAFVIGEVDVVPFFSPDTPRASSDTVGNLIFAWYDADADRIRIYRLSHSLATGNYAQSEQKSRLIEPVPGAASEVRRARPLVEFEEGTGKAVPNIQVEIRGWNDFAKKVQAVSITLDTDTHLNNEGWLIGGGLPASANRWEFLVKVPEFDSSVDYVPINLLGLDVEFDQFAER